MGRKDPFDSLSGVVPGAIATKGVHEQAPTGRDRSDRPLGKRGVAILGQVPLFAGLSRRHLKQIAEHADEIGFRKGEAIVEEDQPGGTFYVILEGEIRVVRHKRTIARMGPGEFFGEISLLVAETPVTAVRVFKRSFDKVVTQEPGVASQILAVVARRLREAERTLSS